MGDLDVFGDSGDSQPGDKLWTTCGKAVERLWTTCGKVIHGFCTGYAQNPGVVENLWISQVFQLLGDTGETYKPTV
jgi:hypothetical protein